MMGIEKEKLCELFENCNGLHLTKDTIYRVEEHLRGKKVTRTKKEPGKLLSQVKDEILVSISFIQLDRKDILETVTRDDKWQTTKTHYLHKEIEFRVYSDSIIISVGSRYGSYSAITIFFKPII